MEQRCNGCKGSNRDWLETRIANVMTPPIEFAIHIGRSGHCYIRGARPWRVCLFRAGNRAAEACSSSSRRRWEGVLGYHLLDFIWTSYIEWNGKHKAQLAKLSINRRPTAVGPATLSNWRIHIFWFCMQSISIKLLPTTRKIGYCHKKYCNNI
jgi:hypothetical protein